MTVSESKFDEYNFYQPLLESQIIVFSPKEYIEVYESWFHTLTGVLVFLKCNPELKDILKAELVRHQNEIVLQLIEIIEEKQKHV
ncbi:MAG: hypothetical protein O8C66_02100 [Candidatus Methanoperedens sp.]|nr:hypothetical protein [Candidatus Methanoperedens sp.]MCZ7369278.1 hypothetical protein [Candidatus Methanoperedens sp.]